MLHPKDLKISDFSYDLPGESIAIHPLATRDASRLLIYDKGDISETVFGELPYHVSAGALLVFNNSKVIRSRLLFNKTGGGKIEIFILEPAPGYGDISTAMNSRRRARFICLVGRAKKWKGGELRLSRPGTIVSPAPDGEAWLTAALVEKIGQEFLVEFTWEPDTDFATALERFGNTPIPPYLNRSADQDDSERYQTVYAQSNGSVAAPTAGLHFTPRILGSLSNNGVQLAYLTLHVGAGTFKPVKSETISGHSMHAEYMEVSRETILQLMDSADIIPVGTTAMRTIESLYWMGVKTVNQPGISQEELKITQWEVYDSLRGYEYAKKEALDSLLHWMRNSGLERLIIETQILIAPPYSPKIATGLITNFHQPQSTLLLLIAALTGDNWKKIYKYAMEHDFRFLSYGDSNLLRW